MGCCQSGARVYGGDRYAVQVNRSIDYQNRESFRREQQKNKVLLLGTGDSGKSTFFKQMKILHGVRLTKEERYHQTLRVFRDIIYCAKVLVRQAQALGVFHEIQCPEVAKAVAALDENLEPSVETGRAIQQVWRDPCIQRVWEQRHHFDVVYDISDSVRYFLDRLEQVMQPSYLASQHDLLYARTRTSGVVTQGFSVEGRVIELYDVGGQRNERRKWIHHFDNVTAVIFVASLAEFDQRLFEDSTKNRMVEALELWEDVCENAHLRGAALVLFLNKRDLFLEKMGLSKIGAVPEWGDFPGPEGDPVAGAKFFLEKFLQRSAQRCPDRVVVHHIT
eukprot:CAMPEP_0194735310 /NCGR_PEP_ID=MMETSP0296-20130528/73037_1 /TAXON_ID=39354 /ORGANISM="Heterosigma akashiwo, Strain CCMP2393" /LENGTH=333 /DNA_ID=CAMNT_0039644457 /DNA_START=65 /DNA_END=1062 /DNA_ORIENTATION=+